ncbi:MAG: glycosyl transferase-like [Planctomycetota bacterium]|nr:MAG: glycosyl transferase-like [Planctomycetota bacterium]
MSTILFASELRAGIGHVRSLAALARELSSRGHSAVFALGNLAEAWPLLRPDAFPLFQAPIQLNLPGKPIVDPASRSLAHILGAAGWSQTDFLEPVVRAWDGLLDRLKPSLVVTDAAPALCLAARGTVPVAQTGAGLFMPPPDQAEFPLLQEAPSGAATPDELLDSVSEVQRRRGRPAPVRLPAIFDAGPQFLTTFVPFDPYSSLRDRIHLGPVDSVPPPLPPPDRPCWFAYLDADNAGIIPTLEALVAVGMPGEAFLRSLTRVQREDFADFGIRLLEAPAPPSELLARASFVVHHGGSGLGCAALAAGRPQLLVPRGLEQALSAANLAAAGVGLIAGEGKEAGDVLHRLAGSKAAAEAAQSEASRIRDAGPWEARDQVIEACLALLNSGENP